VRDTLWTEVVKKMLKNDRLMALTVQLFSWGSASPPRAWASWLEGYQKTYHNQSVICLRGEMSIWHSQERFFC